MIIKHPLTLQLLLKPFTNRVTAASLTLIAASTIFGVKPRPTRLPPNARKASTWLSTVALDKTQATVRFAEDVDGREFYAAEIPLHRAGLWTWLAYDESAPSVKELMATGKATVELTQEELEKVHAEAGLPGTLFLPTDGKAFDALVKEYADQNEVSEKKTRAAVLKELKSYRFSFRAEVEVPAGPTLYEYHYTNAATAMRLYLCLDVSADASLSSSDDPNILTVGQYLSAAAAFGYGATTTPANKIVDADTSMEYASGGRSPLTSSNIGFERLGNSVYAVWLPEAPTNGITALVESLYLDENGDFSPPVAATANSRAEMALSVGKEAPANGILGVSWKYNHLVKLGPAGVLSLSGDVSNVQRLDQSFVAHTLSLPLSSISGYSDWQSPYWTKEVAEVLSYSGHAYNDLLGNVNKGLDDGSYELNKRRSSLSYGLYLMDVSPTSPFQILQQVYKHVESVNAEMVSLAGKPELAKKNLTVNKLRFLGAGMVVERYTTRAAEAMDGRDKEKNSNYSASEAVSTLDPNGIDLGKIPFLSPGVKLMPHQIKALSAVAGKDGAAVMAVDAGGGKTIINLLDIALFWKKNPGKKVLIICPKRLIKNYINTSWLFDDRVNFVPLLAEHMYSDDWGFDKLRRLVKSSPPNTVFLTDFNTFTRQPNRTILYPCGAQELPLHEPTEFFREFDWGGVWIDESQAVKNTSTHANGELSKFINSIPVRRMASGTFVHDTLKDLVGQFNLLNPTVLGSLGAFEAEYMKDGVLLPHSSYLVNQKVREAATYVEVNRVEWQAMLPKRHDTYHPCYLNPKQKEVYKQLVTEAVVAIKEQAEEKASVLKTVLDKGGNIVEGVDGGVTSEEARAQEEKLAMVLAPYFANVERFLTDPAFSSTSASILSKGDLVSPKQAKIVEICRNHFSSNIPGKIIIWTQYVESAKSVYENLPGDLKSKAILYTAAGSAKALLAASSPNVQILVGNEQSMNTGEDLQMFSRIIRLETVWNYGALEQGESRINRPLMGDPRHEKNGGKGIYFDWVFVDETLDVTKIGRMLSKVVDATKFYYAAHPTIDELVSPPRLTMSLDSMLEFHSWKSPSGILKHIQSRQDINAFEESRNREFLANPINANAVPRSFGDGGVLPGSKILKYVPYVDRMEPVGYKGNMEVLISFLEQVGENGEQLITDKAYKGHDLRLHTEYGEGGVKGFTYTRTGEKSSVKVLINGIERLVPIERAYVILNPKLKAVRSGQAKSVGLPLLNVEGANPNEAYIEEEQVEAPKEEYYSDELDVDNLDLSGIGADEAEDGEYYLPNPYDGEDAETEAVKPAVKVVENTKVKTKAVPLQLSLASVDGLLALSVGNSRELNDTTLEALDSLGLNVHTFQPAYTLDFNVSKLPEFVKRIGEAKTQFVEPLADGAFAVLNAVYLGRTPQKTFYGAADSVVKDIGKIELSRKKANAGLMCFIILTETRAHLRFPMNSNKKAELNTLPKLPISVGQDDGKTVIFLKGKAAAAKALRDIDAAGLLAGGQDALAVLKETLGDMAVKGAVAYQKAKL